VSLSDAGHVLLRVLRPAFSARSKTIDDLLGPTRRTALTEAISILTEHAQQQATGRSHF